MLMPSIFGESLIDEFFEDFARPVRRIAKVNNDTPAVMRTDVKESEEGYELDIDLPGYNKEDVQAKLKDGYLTITASVNKNNEEKNNSIGEKYYLNLQHFFKNHTVLKFKPILEQFVKVKIGSHLFHGYLDCCFKDDDDVYHIIDWKTSTVYKGDKAKKECGQLIMYLLALIEAGVPIDKIRIAWNFLKYCTVQYEQANGEVKTRDIERFELGQKLQANLKVWLKKLGYKDQMDDYLKMVVDTNSIECLPET